MKRYLGLVIFFMFFTLTAAATFVLPARIGGSVTVDGVTLTSSTDDGYVFRVTGKDGKDFSTPAEDKDGLNSAGKYIIDIPIYDPTKQPKGAKPESTAVIHVYKNGVEMKVEKPAGGEFIVGKSGTITHIDLKVTSSNPVSLEKK